MKPSPEKIRVAVLLGGDSSEREISLKSGRAAAAGLDPGTYQVELFDPARDLPRLVQAAGEIDAALVMLHGRGGEDGAIQGLLDLLGIPYQCSGVLGCALAMNKPAAKDLFRQAGLPVAPDVVLRRNQHDPRGAVLAEIGLPAVIKPADEGSSFGVSIVHGEADLAGALEAAFELGEVVLAEAFLEGREVTAGVIGNDELQALPLVEIIPREKYSFFDYEAKYKPGASDEICPADLDRETTALVQDLALRAHEALCLKGYSRTDFILADQGPIILESNTIPGMTATSLFPRAARAAGLEMPDLLDLLIKLALESKKK